MKFTCEKKSGKVKCTVVDDNGKKYEVALEQAKEEIARWVKMAGIKEVDIKK